jgi:hypothetical protein
MRAWGRSCSTYSGRMPESSFCVRNVGLLRSSGRNDRMLFSGRNVWLAAGRIVEGEDVKREVDGLINRGLKIKCVSERRSGASHFEAQNHGCST